MMKLFIQLDDTPIELPLARMEGGKISVIRIQDAVPQLSRNLQYKAIQILTQERQSNLRHVQRHWVNKPTAAQSLAA